MTTESHRRSALPGPARHLFLTVSVGLQIFQFTALSASDMKHIADDSRGVGDINACIFDCSGQPVAGEYAERVVGLRLDEIKQIPYRIGVAATAMKALPIYGALRGGYLHTLITDETAARGVLGLFDQNFRKTS